MIVGLVGVQLGGALARPSGALADRWPGVDQGLEEPYLAGSVATMLKLVA